MGDEPRWRNNAVQEKLDLICSNHRSKKEIEGMCVQLPSQQPNHARRACRHGGAIGSRCSDRRTSAGLQRRRRRRPALLRAWIGGDLSLRQRPPGSHCLCMRPETRQIKFHSCRFIRSYWVSHSDVVAAVLVKSLDARGNWEAAVTVS